MKKLFTVFVLTLIILGTSACTDNTRAKYYGGSATIELKQDERLVNITWKESNLWILTKVDASQAPTEYKFQENSIWGVIEGTVTIKEK